MKSIHSESAEKLRGGFYTDPDLAAFLVRWMGGVHPRRILEPSCGDGAFLSALQAANQLAVEHVFACEINPHEANKARARTSAGRAAVEVRTGDFLSWFLEQGGEAAPFDGVLGNPPFIRYQYLPDEQQGRAEQVFRRFELPFTKHTNAWVPFVIASVALLRPGGRLAMVVPSELLHIRHAQPLRRFLLDQCSRTLVLDPEELWFTATLQGTVLLLAEKKPARAGHPGFVAVRPIVRREELRSDPEELFEKTPYEAGRTAAAKWMPLLLNRPERALIESLACHPGVKHFGELASVDVGIVTGANGWFLVPDEVVEEFSLHPWAHPMFGRSEHVAGLVYSLEDHAHNRRAGLPANFLWFQEKEIRDFPTGAQRYLAEAERQQLHTRYKCRVRRPWFKVPSVYVAPVALLKRAHHFPRLILNQAGSYTTDTAYRIRPQGSSVEGLVFAFVNSLTCLSAELEGRHYGGGVLELVPSEIERLLVPSIEPEPGALADADRRYRRSPGQLSFVREQDAFILGRMGLSRPEQDALFAAWSKLRNRRQRGAGSELGRKRQGPGIQAPP